MKGMLLGALVLAGAAQDPTFAEDDWESWNSFGVESSVTYETASSTSDVKVKRTVTLTKKEAECITLTEREEGGEDEEETIEKPEEKPKPPDGSVKCVLCGKHVAAETQEAKETLKIAGKDLECVRQTVRTFDCQGAVTFHQTTWYSREVPGWIAKRETQVASLPKATVTCVGYTKK